MAHDTFTIGDLTAVIGDNDAYDGRLPGFNGVHSLTHRTGSGSPFIFAGLNLEHVFEGDRELSDAATTQDAFFEPRRAPMSFRRLSDTVAELHQPPTPIFGVESRSRFTLVAPHYIDLDVTLRPTKPFAKGWAGVFWASYMDGVEDTSMHLRSDGRWRQHCSPAHNHESSVLHRDDGFTPTFPPGTQKLFASTAILRYDEPLFYGVRDRHVLVFMFDRGPGLRFAHSPSGGGKDDERQTLRPAWDFQLLIEDCRPGSEHRLRMRLAYRERCPRAEILDEYRRWRASLPPG